MIEVLFQPLRDQLGTGQRKRISVRCTCATSHRERGGVITVPSFRLDAKDPLLRLQQSSTEPLVLF
jgi:hypothetical protein